MNSIKMKKIIFMLFVTLGVSLQNVIAQNDSVVLPDYMYKTKRTKEHLQYKLKTNSDYKYDERKGGDGWVTHFTISNKKPVRVDNLVSYNNTCAWWYFKQNMIYSIENNIVASYCLNEDECIIFVRTMEFYKFKYSDSTITYLGDLSETGLFDESIKQTYNESINEVNDILKNNPNDYPPSDRQKDIYFKFRGIRNIEIGRMNTGNLVKVDSVWFLSFEYINLMKQTDEMILLKSTDLKTWTKSKVYLNYKYKMYNEGLKTFIPYLYTYENYDIPLQVTCKINNDIYFSDQNRLIYKSTDNGNTFKIYKIFRPFPEPKLPTFENTNH